MASQLESPDDSQAPHSRGRSLDAEGLLQLLVEHVPGLLFVKDSQFRIVAANQRFLALYPESERDQVLGTTTFEKYDDEQRALFHLQDRIALEHGFTETTETIDFPNGERRTLLTRKVGYTDQRGERFVVGMATDITDLLRSQDAAAQLGRILDHSLNEIYIVDAETLQFRSVNQGVIANLGYSLDEMITMTLADLVPGLPREVWMAHAQALVDGHAERVGIDAKIMRRDRSRIDAELDVQLATLAGEKVLVVTATDRSELVDQRNQLERRNQELREFAYRMSHDMRSPILSAVTLVEIAKRRLAEGRSEEVELALGKALNTLGKIEALTGDIGALAHLDEPSAGRETFDPIQEIDAVVEKLEPAARGVEIERDDHFQGSVHMRRERFQTIVENLVDNAIRFADPSKPTRVVRISTSGRAGGDFVLSCDDNGLGIPAGYAERLFTMFSRLHPRISHGSGLGLYRVRSICEHRGGEAWYEPLPDGSRFSVTFPVPEAGESDPNGDAPR